MTGWTVFSGGAAIAVVMACWGYVRMAWSYLASLLVVRLEFMGSSADIVAEFCLHEMKVSRFGPQTFTGWLAYVRPCRRREYVCGEMIGNQAKMLWWGRAPVMMQRTNPTGSQMDSTDVQRRPVALTYVRWTIVRDDLIKSAFERYNDRDRKLDSRYRVAHITGSAGKRQSDGGSPRHFGAPIAESNPDRGSRVLFWTPSDIGPARPACGSMSYLALSGEAEHLVEDLLRWRESRDWYEARGVPWKMGVMLYGPPGTGKTALVRAIAERLNFPVYSYDLATLYNDELHAQWLDMLSESPCVALFDDIDAAFSGREARHSVTFDCLLNCLDGIERSDGVLTFLTTNHPETLDNALVQFDGGACTRPGRVDRAIEMGPLDVRGRRKLAGRILADWPEAKDLVIEAGDGETGAQFQERCIAEALRRVHGGNGKSYSRMPRERVYA